MLFNSSLSIEENLKKYIPILLSKKIIEIEDVAMAHVIINRVKDLDPMEVAALKRLETKRKN